MSNYFLNILEKISLTKIFSHSSGNCFTMYLSVRGEKTFQISMNFLLWNHKGFSILQCFPVYQSIKVYFTLSFLVAQSKSETYQLCLSLSLFAKLFSQLYMYLLLAYTVTDSLILKYKIYQGHCISMSVVDWPFHHIYQIISMKESFWRL